VAVEHGDEEDLDCVAIDDSCDMREHPRGDDETTCDELRGVSTRRMDSRRGAEILRRGK